MEISATLSIHSIPKTSPSLSISSSNSLFFNGGGTDLLLKKKKTNQLVMNRSSKAQSQRGFTCRCMFGLGVPEIVVIAGVATLLFGPKKLPEIGRSFGQTFKSFQQAAKEFESELKKEPEPEPVVQPPLAKQTVASEEEKQGVQIPSTKESL